MRPGTKPRATGRSPRTQEFTERAEKQRDAFQTLVGGSAGAYSRPLYPPLAYYRQGLRLVEGEVNGGVFPMSNYDELNDKEITERPDSLSPVEIRTIGEYEKRNKNRQTLIERIERKLKAAS